MLDGFAPSGTTAHRLASGAGGWVERLGSDVIISYKAEPALPGILAEFDAWSSDHALPVERVFGRLLPRQNDERAAPVLLRGEAGPLQTVVTENNLRYAIDFEAGYSAGLFLDQRANRALVREMKGGRLLNTFAYTCSFSVVAALAGAETVSVDLSRKSLDRGRENFALNALSDDGHRFLADDVLDVLPRLVRRGEKFDTVVVDPPTFSRGNKGRRWQIERDFEGLLANVLEVVAPGGRVLLSTNCTAMNRRALELAGRYALKLHRLYGSFHQAQPLVDFPSPHGAQSLWLQLR